MGRIIAPGVTVLRASMLMAAPTSFTVTTPDHEQFALNLAWVDNSRGEIAYEVQVSDDGSTGWTTVVDDLPSNTESYQATGLSHNTEYFFRVRALFVGGAGNWSDVESATTLFNPEVFADDNGAAMVSWLDFDDPSVLFQDTAAATPVTGSSQPIGRVNNKISGAPFFSNGTTAQKPTFDGSKALFDGGDSLLSSSGAYWSFFNDGTRHVTIARLQLTSLTLNDMAVIWDHDSLSSGRGLQLYVDDRNVFSRNNVLTFSCNPFGFTLRSPNDGVGADPFTVTCRHEYDLAGDDAIMRIDGVQVATGNSAAGPNTAENPNPPRIGAQQNNTGRRWFGPMWRIWTFTDLADTDIPALEAAIAQ